MTELIAALSQLDFERILRIVDIYQSEIDWAIRSQIDAMLDGDDAENQNPNALRYVRDFVTKLYRDDFIDEDERDDLIDLFTPPEDDDANN